MIIRHMFCDESQPQAWSHVFNSFSYCTSLAVPVHPCRGNLIEFLYPKMAGWFIVENPMEMDDFLGYPHFTSPRTLQVALAPYLPRPVPLRCCIASCCALAGHGFMGWSSGAPKIFLLSKSNENIAMYGKLNWNKQTPFLCLHVYIDGLFMIYYCILCV